jgi:ankyrin repeat protein
MEAIESENLISGGEQTQEELARLKRQRSSDDEVAASEWLPAAKRAKGEEIEQPITGQLYLEALPLMVARGYLDGRSLLRAANVCKGARWDARAWERVVKSPVGEEKQTPLMASAFRGDEERVRWFLSIKADPNVQNKVGVRPLMFAAQEGHMTVIKALLEHKADVDAKDSDGNSALHFAAIFDKRDAALALLQGGGADINLADNKKQTALHHAALLPDGENFCLTLLDHGADPRAAEEAGWQLIHFAAWKGHLGLVNRLIEMEVDLDAAVTNGATALFLACRHGREGVAMRLFALGRSRLDLTAGRLNSTCLHASCKSGLHKVTEKLLDLGLDIEASNNLGETPLHVAAEKGHTIIISLLISRGAGVNSRDEQQNTPLLMAASKGQAEAVALLLQRGANAQAVDSSRESALHLAAEGGHAAVVEVLLRHNAEVDATSFTRDTPLILAAEKGHAAVVTQLIAAKAKVDARGAGGVTALVKAIEGDHLGVVTALLEAGAELDCSREKETDVAIRLGRREILKELLDAEHVDRIALACENGQDGVVQELMRGRQFSDKAVRRHPHLLHQACWFPIVRVVEELLKHGYPIDGLDKEGKTPLHRVAETVAVRHVLPTLLRLGPDLETVDADGNTALHLAVTRRNKMAVLRLLQAGANPAAVTRDERTALVIALENDIPALVQLLVQHPCGVEAARDFLHNNPTAWPQEARDALILYLVDSRQLLTPGRNACSPETREVVEAALARFAARISEPNPDRLAISPYRQLIRWFLGAPSAEAPEVTLPLLPAVTSTQPPAGMTDERYREKRTALLRNEARARRDRLVAFYAKGQKAKAAAAESKGLQDSQSAGNAIQEDADGSRGAGGSTQ